MSGLQTGPSRYSDNEIIDGDCGFLSESGWRTGPRKRWTFRGYKSAEDEGGTVRWLHYCPVF